MDGWTSCSWGLPQNKLSLSFSRNRTSWTHMSDGEHLPRSFSSRLYMPVWQSRQTPILHYCVILLYGPLGTDVITEKHAPEESRPVCACSYVNVQHTPTGIKCHRSWFIVGGHCQLSGYGALWWMGLIDCKPLKSDCRGKIILLYLESQLLALSGSSHPSVSRWGQWDAAKAASLSTLKHHSLPDGTWWVKKQN